MYDEVIAEDYVFTWTSWARQAGKLEAMRRAAAARLADETDPWPDLSDLLGISDHSQGRRAAFRHYLNGLVTEGGAACSSRPRGS